MTGLTKIQEVNEWEPGGLHKEAKIVTKLPNKKVAHLIYNLSLNKIDYF